VNLFLPQPTRETPASAEVEVYRQQLAGEATWYETALGDPDSGSDDAFSGKVAILRHDPVPVVSFTFGCPDPELLEQFAEIGTLTVVTATTLAEAEAAERAGADAVCVQGVEAGGHQATHHDDPQSDGAGRGVGLLTLVAEVSAAVRIPVIAAGGLMRG